MAEQPSSKAYGLGFSPSRVKKFTFFKSNLSNDLKKFRDDLIEEENNIFNTDVQFKSSKQSKVYEKYSKRLQQIIDKHSITPESKNYTDVIKAAVELIEVTTPRAKHVYGEKPKFQGSFFGLNVDENKNSKLPYVSGMEVYGGGSESLWSKLKPLKLEFYKQLQNAKSPEEIESIFEKMRPKFAQVIKEFTDKYNIDFDPHSTANVRHASYNIRRLVNETVEEITAVVNFAKKGNQNVMDDSYKQPIVKTDKNETQDRKVIKQVTPKPVESVRRPSILSRVFHRSSRNQEEEIPVSVQRLQTFLTNKSDSYYMQNVKPLFPINEESRDGAMSKPDFQNLFADRNLVRDIVKMTDNPQLVSRIYASALAVGLNSNRESLAVQENFGNLESTVQQFVEAGILDKNRLPKIAQDRLESMDKQRGGRH